MNYSNYRNQDIGSMQIGYNKYKYILNKEDLVSAYIESREYPLRKEVKRDRFVENTEGLKKHIDKVLNELITEASHTMAELIKEDAAAAVQDVLDSVNVINNQFVVNPKRKNNSSNKGLAERLGKAMGKAIGRASSKILKEITSGDRKRN